jgi:hypothetical protein
MPQPDSPPPDGDSPGEPKSSWKAFVFLPIVISLLGAAYVFHLFPKGNTEEVTYPQFLEMLKKGEIDKTRGVDLITNPGSLTDYVRAFRAAPAGQPASEKKVKAEVNLASDRYLKATLEDDYGVVVSPKTETGFLGRTWFSQ